MTDREHRRLVRDVEQARAEARRLRAAIRRHHEMVTGGPAVDFGAADRELWEIVGIGVDRRRAARPAEEAA